MGKQNNKKGARPFVGLTYHYMEYCFRLGVHLNALPFKYNKATLHYEVNTTGYKFILWSITMLGVVLLELGQMAKELIITKVDKSFSRGDWCPICFLFISWIFITSIHLNVILHPHEMVNHLNQLLQTRRWFTEGNLPPTGDHKVVRTQMWFCALQCFFQALMISVERTKGHFLYSYLPANYENVATVTMWVLYAYYRVTTNFISGLFQYFAGVLHVQTCTQVLALRRQKETKQTERLKYYRMLQALSNRLTESYGSVFFPNVTLFIVSNIILGTYGIIKLHTDLEFDKLMNFPIMVSVMLLVLITFYPKMATVYEQTKDEYLDSLRRATAAVMVKEAFIQVKVESAQRITVQRDDEDVVHAAELIGSCRSTSAWQQTRCVARSC